MLSSSQAPAGESARVYRQMEAANLVPREAGHLPDALSVMAMMRWPINVGSGAHSPRIAVSAAMAPKANASPRFAPGEG